MAIFLGIFCDIWNVRAHRRKQRVGCLQGFRISSSVERIKATYEYDPKCRQYADSGELKI